MIIDYHKLTELLLPTQLRKPKLFAMLSTLVAKPMQRLFSAFNVHRHASRYESSVTPQVCYLQHAVERRFDCKCEITELDGKPFDFLVTIDRSLDLYAIRDFIDRHKLAGRSYVFELGDVVWSALWIGHVDEDIIEVYKATWIDHVDEQDGVNRVHVAFRKTSNGWQMMANADRPVKSLLTVKSWVHNQQPDDSGIALALNGSLTLEIGQDSKVVDAVVIAEPSDNTMLTTSITPQSDDYYRYLTNDDNYIIWR